MADESKPDNAQPEPLALAALQAQIAQAFERLDDYDALLKELNTLVRGGIAAQHDGRFAAIELRLREIEAALVPIAAVVVEVWPNVCHANPQTAQAQIKAAMPPINRRVAQKPRLERAKVVPGEQFDPARPDGSVMVAPDRSQPNIAGADYPTPPAPQRGIHPAVQLRPDEREGELGSTTDE